MLKSQKEGNQKDNYVEADSYPDPRHAGYVRLREHTFAGNGPARTFFGSSTPEPNAHLRVIGNGLAGLQVKLEIEALKSRNFFILMTFLKATPLVLDTIRYILPFCKEDFSALYEDKVRPAITDTISSEEESDFEFEDSDNELDDGNVLNAP